MPEPLVLGEHVARMFGTEATRAVAIEDATFRIEPGALIALTGPSGSGKSTLLHLIGGLDSPTSGTLSWPGLGEPATLRPSQIAIVFQGPSLITPISVLDNVALPMLLAGAPAAEAAGRAVVELNRFQIGHLAQKMPEEISGGESQRAAIARALAIRPKMILADEPTGQLDSATAAHVIDLLLQTARTLGAAVVISTHDARIAERMPIRWNIRGGLLITSPVDAGLTSMPAL